MIFEEIQSGQAEGLTLAHTLKLPGRTLRKGQVLSADDVAALGAAGIERVAGAWLTVGDLSEDAAAAEIAGLIAGDNLVTRPPSTGRGNLYASAPGLLQVDRECVAPRIAALVLAAGASSRMGGQNKLLRKVDGRPLVRHAVDAALASRCSQVMVVTGCEAESVESTLDRDRVSIVRNLDFARGMSTSLRAGLAALPVETAAVLVLLGDMPRVSAAHIDRILDAFEPGRPAILVPSFRGRRGNPVLWPRRFFAELRAIVGDTGARGLLQTHAAAVVAVPIDSEAILADVDTPADVVGLVSR